MKNILAIAPHPDDIELGCVGTLLKFKDLGYNIDIIITVCPSAEINNKRSQQIVELELQKSMDLLGFNFQVFNTPLSSSLRPRLEWNNDTITAIENMFIKDHYDLVITTDSGDYHQDHVNTFNIVNSACRGTVDELWTMEIIPYSHRNISFNPSIFIDITSTFDLKIQSLLCYNSYITEDIIHAVKGLAMYRSQMLQQSSYTEAFKQVFKIGI